MSLYTEIVAAGIETDSHESDLYFPATPEARRILARWTLEAGNAVYFQHATKRTTWIDVPFAFDPWWARRAAEADAYPRSRKVRP